MNVRRAQGGMTLLGFVMVLAVVGCFAYVAMKLFPMYQEFYAVKSAMKSLAKEPGVGQMTPAQVQELFFKRLDINYSESVKPKDVKLTRTDRGYQMSVNYEVRREMAGNLDVVGRFNAEEALTAAGLGE